MGNWKNYDELEENLSIDELIYTLNAYRKRQGEEHKFMAALQGVDLSDNEPVDITDMTPSQVVSSGFGVGMGLGHSVESISQEVAVN